MLNLRRLLRLSLACRRSHGRPRRRLRPGACGQLLPIPAGPCRARRALLPGAGARQADSSASPEVLFPFSVCQLRCATRCGRHPGNTASAFFSARSINRRWTCESQRNHRGQFRPCGFPLSSGIPARPSVGSYIQPGCRLGGSCIVALDLVFLTMFRYPPAGHAKPGRGLRPGNAPGVSPFAVLVLPAGFGALSRPSIPTCRCGHLIGSGGSSPEPACACLLGAVSVRSLCSGEYYPHPSRTSRRPREMPRSASGFSPRGQASMAGPMTGRRTTAMGFGPLSGIWLEAFARANAPRPGVLDNACTTGLLKPATGSHPLLVLSE